MRSLAGRKWPGGYSFIPFRVESTGKEFHYSKGVVQTRAEKIIASNLSAAWNCHGLDETLISGILQGRRATDPRGASLVSRWKMWALALQLAALLGATCTTIRHTLEAETYGESKRGELLKPRREAKEDARRDALKGWVSSIEDTCFGIGSRG